MSNELEYRTFPVKQEPVQQIVAALDGLAAQGWELLSSPKGEFGNRWVEVRRPRNWNASFGTWEHHVFQTKPAPYGWNEHLGSCGWIELQPALYEYHRSVYSLFKRASSCRGTDDGDIEHRLADLGCSYADFYNWEDRSWLPDVHQSLHEELLRKVLKVKWEESVRRGSNIGTYPAVRCWIVNELMPLLRARYPFPYRDEQMLDILLSLRESARRGYYVPSLMEAAKLWSKSA